MTGCFAKSRSVVEPALPVRLSASSNIAGPFGCDDKPQDGSGFIAKMVSLSDSGYEDKSLVARPAEPLFYAGSPKLTANPFPKAAASSSGSV
jgi:hypothetical protein